MELPYDGRHAVVLHEEIRETPLGRLLEELWFVEGRAYNLKGRFEQSTFEQWYRWLQEIRIGLEERLKVEQSKLLQIEFGNQRLLATVFAGDEVDE